MVKDILECQPSFLVNCYSLKELNDSIKFLIKTGYTIAKSKEIVPNDYNLGLVRDMNLDDKTITNLKMQKRFRYYFLFTANTKKRPLCLTFNPECNNNVQIPVKLETGVIRCSTLQVAIEKLKGRDLESIKHLNTEQGMMNYYDL